MYVFFQKQNQNQNSDIAFEKYKCYGKQEYKLFVKKLPSAILLGSMSYQALHPDGENINFENNRNTNMNKCTTLGSTVLKSYSKCQSALVHDASLLNY